MSYVYFVQAKNGGPVKIGTTTGEVEKRIEMLQAGNPEKIVLLAKMEGDMKVEKALHEAFSDERIHGEWFTPSQRLMTMINNINEGKFEFEVRVNEVVKEPDPNRKVTVSTALERELVDALNEIGKREQRSLSYLINRIVRQHLLDSGYTFEHPILKLLKNAEKISQGIHS